MCDNKVSGDDKGQLTCLFVHLRVTGCHCCFYTFIYSNKIVSLLKMGKMLAVICSLCNIKAYVNTFVFKLGLFIKEDIF